MAFLKPKKRRRIVDPDANSIRSRYIALMRSGVDKHTAGKLAIEPPPPPPPPPPPDPVTIDEMAANAPDLPWPKLKSLAESFTSDPIQSRKHAIEVIMKRERK